MKIISSDIVICGGGLSGMITCQALSNIGISVCCVDKSTINFEDADDFRSTAYLSPSKRFLDEIGLWKHLSKHANPLKILKIINSESKFPFNKIVTEKDFCSDEILKDEFGWNINNNKTKLIIAKLLKDNPLVKYFGQNEIVSIDNDHSSLIIKLKNKKVINTKLLIGADGKNSFVRNYYNIGLNVKDLKQKAITFIIEHNYPHNDVSSEIYLSGGPFTIVPMKNDINKNISAVVWMDNSFYIDFLLSLNNEKFEKEVNKRSCNILGSIAVKSKLKTWEISSQVAKKLINDRVLLLGEAAHVLPPIGAQGLNLTLKDIKTIYDLIRKNRSKIGDFEMLSKYNFQRMIDIKIRSKSVDFLNKISNSDEIIIKKARDFGLNALDKIKPIKYLVMRFGLG